MKRALFLGSALICAGAAWTQVALAQPAIKPGVESRLTFEDGQVFFQPFGEGAQVSLTREAAHVKEGRSAMRFDYKVAAGQLNAAVVAGVTGAATNIKSLSFWVQADYETTLSMMLQEQGGGRYIALFHAPKDKWQRVELALSDFTLSQEKTDPVDPNRKLDMDLVEVVAIGDFNQLLAQSQNDDLKKLLQVQTGAHTFYIDDFWANPQPLAPTPGVDPADATIIDSFVSPQVGWLSLGDAQLQRVTSVEQAAQQATATVRDRGLQLQYRQKAGTVMGLLRRLPAGHLRGMTAIKFTVATAKPLVLIVQFEESSGGKYNTTVELPGDNKPMDVRLVPTLFNKSDDSKDDNNRLDADQVQQIMLLDIAGLIGGAEGENQIWISDVRVEKPQP